jgi:hypothetical protein
MAVSESPESLEISKSLIGETVLQQLSGTLAFTIITWRLRVGPDIEGKGVYPISTAEPSHFFEFVIPGWYVGFGK